MNAAFRPRVLEDIIRTSELLFGRAAVRGPHPWDIFAARLSGQGGFGHLAVGASGVLSTAGRGRCEQVSAETCIVVFQMRWGEQSGQTLMDGARLAKPILYHGIFFVSTVNVFLAFSPTPQA